MRKAGGSRHVLVGICLAAGISVTPPGEAGAQGLSDASVEGVVLADSASAVAGAIVTLTETATGALRKVRSNRHGAYFFENVAVGSYRLEARAIGLNPAVIDTVSLQLGDRLRLNLVLSRNIASELTKITISETVLRDPGAGGPAYSIPRAIIRSLPLVNRDFVGLFALSSQAVGPGSLWVSGQHNRFNGIQIDGAIGNDIFGTNITPGSGAGGKSVSLESLDQIRILVAPFDVRQGGFSGGLINAVTRSGSNAVRGSIFSSYARSELVGPDTAGAGVATFDQLQYGVSAGGPVIRDRLHYFAVLEAQSRSTGFAGPSVDQIETGVTRETAVRAARVFRERYGFDPGGPDAPRLDQPNANLFLKLSWHPSAGHSVELTQSALRARSENLNRFQRNQNSVNGWQLSNSGSQTRSNTFSSRIKSVSVLGNLTNEGIVAVTVTDDRIESRNRVPLFIVEADLPGHYLAAGSTKSAQGTRTTRRTIELTDNLSWRRGAHLLTVGTQNVLFSVRDNFSLGSWGVWTFGSVEALEKNEASRYEVSIPLTGQGPFADYSSAMLSAYVQDRWNPVSALTLTAGARIDAPFFDSPRRNATLASNDLLGRIDTGDFPSANVVLAPRFGFAWNLGSGRRSMLRGGVGAFTGRPPLVWMTGAYSTTGQEQTTLICGPTEGVPAPTSDVTRLPEACLAPARTSLPSVNYFDPGFRFQRAIKYAVGLDHTIGKSTLVSLDFIHTTSRDNMSMRDVNLVEVGMTSEGRAMYGILGSTGAARPQRLDSIRFGPVFGYENVNSDRSTSVSVSAHRQLAAGGMVQLGYNWSRALDVMSLSGLISSVIASSNPIDGTMARRNLRRSARDIPHNFSAAVTLPPLARTTVSGFLRARSGTPFAFTVRGDPNADGVAGNDLAYIPDGIGDFSLRNPEAYPAFAAMIESQPCLRQQRGRIMKRNSCRNSAVVALDARVARKFVSHGDRGVEISADLFNVPNMLNRNWGLVRETSPREDQPLLTVSGWDAAMNRPRYSIPVVDGSAVLPAIDRVVADPSRWRIQLGARYDF